MADAAIEFIVRELLVQLKACTVLKAKCRTLTGFLVNLQSELPKMKDFDEGLLEMEAILIQLKDTLDTVAQKRRGKLSGVLSFFLSRKKVNELDDCHMKLVELLEQFRVRQANRLERNMDHMKNIMERLEEQIRSDNRDDLKEDRAKFLAVLEEEGGDDKEVAELLEIGEEMDEEELDAALKTVSRAKLLMESIATRTQMEECTLQANISPSDLTIYEVDRLGSGSFGEVLAGKLGDQSVAIKRPLATPMMLFKAQDDLRKEAEKWQTLDHKNIVRLLGTCIYENKLLLVMEKCDMTLFDLLYTHTELLSLDCFETIARGILRGLAYLHGKHFIHRDLKPMNVLLSYDLGRVKLSDFGLLAAKEEYATYAKTSTVRGTWLYMAPEVLDEPARWTTRADMYSFALVCWEILHREIPWGSNTNPLVLSKKIARGERPVFSDNVVLKPWQLELIQKCWDQEPRNRPSASDALATIEKLASSRRSTKILKGMLSFLKKTRSTAMDPFKDEEIVKGLHSNREGAHALRFRLRKLPDWCKYHVFISHRQASGGDMAGVLAAKLEARGLAICYDQSTDGNLTEPEMKRGIREAKCYLLLLTKGVFESAVVCMELRSAMDLGKPILFIHEAQTNMSGFDVFWNYVSTCPDEAKHLFEEIESLPFQRRKYLEDSFYKELIKRIDQSDS